MPSAGSQSSARPRRTRDPEGKRSAILVAARQVFAERGFAKATIREIARRADVTHGLVLLHFSSKEQLFLAAVPGPRDLAENVAGDPAGLPARIAEAFVRRMESADGADPFIALIRSAAADQEAATALLRALAAESVAAYRPALTGPDTEERVELVGALLIGITFSRYVLRGGTLATMPAAQLTDYLTQALTAILRP
jgi:hypothetical protein